MIRNYFLALLIIAVLASLSEAALYEAAMATVRVRCGDGVGSGVVVGANDQAYFALSNAHVADRAQCTIEFFAGGKMSAQVTGCPTVSRDPQNDVAVIQIPKKNLSGHVPTIMPIDPAFELKAGEPICSVGHPHGENPTAFVGGYVGLTQGGSITFRPPPKQGRSGSALFDRDFTRVIGLIWGCDLDNVKDRLGYGVPARKFSTALGKELSKTTIANAPIDFKEADKVTFYDSSVAAEQARQGVLDRLKNRRENPDNRPPILRRGLRRENPTPNPEAPAAPEPTIPDNLQTAEPAVNTAIKLEIGDISLGISSPGQKKPEQPTPPQAPRPPRPLPPGPFFPPPGPYPIPRPIAPPPPFGAAQALPTVTTCQYRPSGTCPSGSCPTTPYYYPVTPAPNKPAAIKPTAPIPVNSEPETTLPDPEAVVETKPRKSETPSQTKTPEIPVAIVHDPRLDKIPAIEETLFGLSSGQSGIEKKVDSTLDKVSKLIDEKKESVKVDLEQFRNETLIALDERTGALRTDIDERLALVQNELGKLEATNQEISQLKESIDNFSIFPDASGFVKWLYDWGWFLTMLTTVVVLGGLQAKQYYNNKIKPSNEKDTGNEPIIKVD